jgi:hypothetical protein
VYLLALKFVEPFGLDRSDTHNHHYEAPTGEFRCLPAAPYPGSAKTQESALARILPPHPHRKNFETVK